MELKKEFADEIYIFVSPDKPGIRFYDHSPIEVVAKFAGSLPEGKFHTSLNSIKVVGWDSSVNVPNGSQLLKYMDGDVTARTYMVSEKQFNDIINAINMQSKENNDPIIIDIGIPINLKKDNDTQLSNLHKIKDELNKIIGDDVSEEFVNFLSTGDIIDNNNKTIK